MSFFDDANAEYDRQQPRMNVRGPETPQTLTSGPLPVTNDTTNGPATGAPSTGPHAWIDEALKAAQSTDDPSYWYRVIAQDPKVAAGDKSAIDYWKNRIAIGDGAAAVRNGSAQRFNDGPQMGQRRPAPTLAQLGNVPQFRPQPSFQPLQGMGQPPPMQQGPMFRQPTYQPGAAPTTYQPGAPPPTYAPAPNLAQLGQLPFNYRIAGK